MTTPTYLLRVYSHQSHLTLPRHHSCCHPRCCCCHHHLLMILQLPPLQLHLPVQGLPGAAPDGEAASESDASRADAPAAALAAAPDLPPRRPDPSAAVQAVCEAAVVAPAVAAGLGGGAADLLSHLPAAHLHPHHPQRRLNHLAQNLIHYLTHKPPQEMHPHLCPASLAPADPACLRLQTGLVQNNVY